MTRAADIVLLGRVFTAVPGAPWAEGVALRDGVVTAVGDEAAVRAAIGPRTEVRVVTGGLICPAFQDAHIHLAEGSLFDLWCNVHDVAPERYLETIGAYAASLPAGAWVRGGGWSMAAFEGGSPLRGPLDAVVGDRPAYLTARDGHSAWVSTRALELAGITRETPDPPGGRIERDAGGDPSGTLHETAIRLVLAHLPEVTQADWRAALELGQRSMHALGITAWHDARVEPEILDAYRALDADGGLHGRAAMALWWNPARGVEQLAELEAQRASVRAGGNVTAPTAKIFVDGVLENHTAALTDPYSGVEPPTRGEPLYDAETLNAAVAACAGAGFQVHFHAIGDWAVRAALDACAHARELHGVRDLRHQISHLQVVDPRDLGRFAQLGVVANLQAYWACMDEQMRTLCLPVLGERGAWQYPFASLRDAGAPIAMGSDWRVSTPDPLKQMEVAVTRREEGRPDAEPLLAGEALTLHDALLGFTAGAAFANHLDAETGTLAAGMSADLVVLDRDPFAGPAHEIGRTAVVLTLHRGRVVHERSGAGGVR